MDGLTSFATARSLSSARSLGRGQCQSWCDARECKPNTIGSCGGCPSCLPPLQGKSCLIWGVRLTGKTAVLITDDDRANSTGIDMRGEERYSAFCAVEAPTCVPRIRRGVCMPTEYWCGEHVWPTLSKPKNANDPPTYSQLLPDATANGCCINGELAKSTNCPHEGISLPPSPPKPLPPPPAPPPSPPPPPPPPSPPRNPPPPPPSISSGELPRLSPPPLLPPPYFLTHHPRLPPQPPPQPPHPPPPPFPPLSPPIDLDELFANLRRTYPPPPPVLDGTYYARTVTLSIVGVGLLIFALKRYSENAAKRAWAHELAHHQW